MIGAAAPPAGLGSHDLHVHTSMSDGDLSLERVVEIACVRRVEVGVADHVSTRNLQRFIATEFALRHYLDALDEAPVFRSGEFCWCDTMWRSLPEELMQRFDYRIGSNHGFWLPDGGLASPWWQALPPPWDREVDQLVEIMVLNLCDLVRTMPIEIIAHATLLPPALLEREPDVEAWWLPEHEDRFVEALLESGVAMEISNRYRLPHDRLLRKALQAGVRFSLGSDGHTEAQVGRLDWAVATAERVGIGAADLFVPAPRRRRRKSRPVPAGEPRGG